MIRYFALVISALFHPLFMPLIGMYVIIQDNIIMRLILPVELHHFIYLTFFVCTILFPALTIAGLKIRGAVSSLHLPTKEERKIPLLAGNIYYFLAFWIIQSVWLSTVLNAVMISGMAILVLVLMINYRFKISIHMAALGSLTGLLTVYTGKMSLDHPEILYIVVGISGLVGFARMALKAHSSAELISGYFTGFITQYILLNWVFQSVWP